MSSSMTIKILLSAIALLGIFACAAQTRSESGGAQGPSTTSSPSTMKETIIGFSSEPRYIRVTFSKSARPFDLQVAQGNFVEVMTKIATAYKSKQEVIPIIDAEYLVDIDLE